jgi:hypothetical protein
LEGDNVIVAFAVKRFMTMAPGVGLEELLVLRRLVHEGDDDNPEQNDGENGAKNKTELEWNINL